MRFSFWPGPLQPWEEILELARHVERTGWDGFWFADHFMPNAEDTSGQHAECWTTLTGVAALVPRLRIGALVSGNTYRHPAVLAKMAAGLDHVSGGRAVLGLGAGWQENEHTAYGIPFYTVAERLGRLDEACQLIKSLFEQERTSFQGRYYQLKDAPLEPKPVSQPLPLLVGGGGEKVTMRIAAQYADEWNVWGAPELQRAKGKVLAGHCEKLGRDPASIHRSAQALLFLSDDEGFLSAIRGNDAIAHKIVGNVAEVSETVAAYRDAGVDELIIPDFTLGPRERKLETLDRFQEEVASQFR